MIEDERKLKKEKVIEYLSKLPIYKWAAAFAGINQDTLKDWRKEDTDFSDRCETAKSEAIERLGRRATPDFILKNVDPDTFKDKKEVENFNFEVTRRNEDTSQHVRSDEPTRETEAGS